MDIVNAYIQGVQTPIFVEVDPLKDLDKKFKTEVERQMFLKGFIDSRMVRKIAEC